MNIFQEKQKAKRERLLALADKASEKAKQHQERSHDGLPPFGEPIKIGHHSERRHRAAIAASHRHMMRSIDEKWKEANYRGQAAAVGRGGISSDDPEAVKKLEAKLANLEESQKRMKSANQIVRRYGENEAACVEVLVTELGIGETTAREIVAPDFTGRRGFASYVLCNNNAKIKHTKQRLARLKVASTAKPQIERGKGLMIEGNVATNRLQLNFDEKPNETVRTFLKRKGFKWSRTAGVWQRQLDTLPRKFTERLTASEELGDYFG